MLVVSRGSVRSATGQTDRTHARLSCRVPRVPHVALAVRRQRIRQVADDLARELFRAQGRGLGAVAMAAYIQQESTAVRRALRALAPSNRRMPATRR